MPGATMILLMRGRVASVKTMIPGVDRWGTSTFAKHQGCIGLCPRSQNHFVTAIDPWLVSICRSSPPEKDYVQQFAGEEALGTHADRGG